MADTEQQQQIPTNMAEWKSQFQNLSNLQNTALRTDASVKEVLRQNNLQLLYRTWSDVGRSQNSSVGNNITDMTFFGVAPESFRPNDYKNQSDDAFVSFPALRPPNFTDEVDIMTASQIPMKVKNRFGHLVNISLRDFLANIGWFIDELPMETNWGYDIDKGPMQVANQFSVLPAPTGAADVGIAAFGYQKKNLHIVIGPSGDIGWAPEQHGASRIYFREKKDLVTIALVPEDREEVKQQFFKEADPNETVEQEAERYQAVENFIHHIQIEMNLPHDYVHTQNRRRIGVGRGAPGGWGRGRGGVKSSRGRGGFGGAPRMKRRKCKSNSRGLKSARRRERSDFDPGLNLARVKAGKKIGNATLKDRVPKGPESGQIATRRMGVAVRLTKMYYAVAQDGLVTAERVSRFCQQMSFERRSKNLHHGSLVTGYGTWGVPKDAPIKLEELPPTLAEIKAMVATWTGPAKLRKLIPKGDVIPEELQALQPGGTFSINEDGVNVEFQKCQAENAFLVRMVEAEA